MLVFIFDLEMKILEWFWQIGNNILNFIFYLISQFGGSLIIIIVLSIIYWCFDKDKAEKIGYAVLTSLCFNNCLKSLISFKRPFEYEGYEHLQKLRDSSLSDSSSGSSFPSGHSQIGGVLYTSISLNYPKKKIIISAIILMVLIPISRLYLGVHFPSDVIVGLGLGIIIALFSYFLLNKFANHKFIIYIVTSLIFLPFIFIKNVEYDLTRSYGLLLGFLFGRWFENKFVHFSKAITVKQKSLRLLIGFSIVGFLYVLIGFIPKGISHLPIISICLHFLLCFVIMGIIPLIFKNERNQNGI